MTENYFRLPCLSAAALICIKLFGDITIRARKINRVIHKNTKPGTRDTQDVKIISRIDHRMYRINTQQFTNVPQQNDNNSTYALTVVHCLQSTDNWMTCSRSVQLLQLFTTNETTNPSIISTFVVLVHCWDRFCVLYLFAAHWKSKFKNAFVFLSMLLFHLAEWPAQSDIHNRGHTDRQTVSMNFYTDWHLPSSVSQMADRLICATDSNVNRFISTRDERKRK